MEHILSPLVRGGSKAGFILTERNPLRQSRSVTNRREVIVLSPKKQIRE